jgi:hypothetical protein
MMLLPRLVSRLRALVLLLPAFAIGTLLSGCGGHAHRPASSLSDHERAVLADYEQIRAGLAANDSRATNRGAAALLAELKKTKASPSSPRLIAQVEPLATARALDSQREAFKEVSETLVPVAEGVDGYYIMTCPPGFTGEWIQRTPDIDNPYFGKVMHNLGTLKK